MRFIGAGKPRNAVHHGIFSSDVILISIPDRAISGMAADLANVGAEELHGKIVLHTSGCADSNALASLRKYGAAVASMHPMQTFGGVGVPNLQGRLFAIEGDESAVRVARRMARSLGGIPIRITSKDKPLYHAAGTMAASHVLTIVDAATRLLMSIGLKRKEAVQYTLLPMTRQVLDNDERFGPRNAWTGPLSRGDGEVVSAHIRALEKFSPEYREAYEALSHLALLVLAKDEDKRWGISKKKTDKRVKAMAMGGNK